MVQGGPVPWGETLKWHRVCEAERLSTGHTTEAAFQSSTNGSNLPRGFLMPTFTTGKKRPRMWILHETASSVHFLHTHEISAASGMNTLCYMKGKSRRIWKATRGEGVDTAKTWLILCLRDQLASNFSTDCSINYRHMHLISRSSRQRLPKIWNRFWRFP